MKQDFSDLRFTMEDGETELSYWIESYVAGISAKVWVKTDLPVQELSLYMYYGNPLSSTTSRWSTTMENPAIAVATDTFRTSE